jgi:hypothetical protein
MDPYDLLDLQPTASPEDIRAAYRRRAAEWHPDRQPAEKKAESVERMVQINAARDLLLDTQRRIQYHREHENALRWKMDAERARWQAAPAGETQRSDTAPHPSPSARRRSWAFIYETQRRQGRQRFYRQLLVVLLALSLVFVAGLLILLGLAGDAPAAQAQKAAMVTAVTLWFSMASSLMSTLGLTLLVAFVAAGLSGLFRH